MRVFAMPISSERGERREGAHLLCLESQGAGGAASGAKDDSGNIRLYWAWAWADDVGVIRSYPTLFHYETG